MTNIHHILQQYWGYATFRDMQEDIVNSVLSGNDTLALLPTGGGKSICFQVPALAMDGICIVVSPLIALMQDQVMQLNRRNIGAKAIHSGLSFKEIDILLDNCVFGKDIKFLYTSPERLLTELFQERVKRMNVSLLAIDEAHCISQWGYDFRPPYLEIAKFREILPKNVPCIALTASATEKVKKDIVKRLNFNSNHQIFQKSFSRSNLSYSVFQENKKELKLLEMLQKVQGSAIIYLRSRKKVENIAKWLQTNNISASFYHAGLITSEREKRQYAWIQGQTRVMVATNAFGMGIDKPDVRLVVHLDLTTDLESYYQEAGRAGRDNLKAYASILYEQSDIEKLNQSIETSFPKIEFIREVYQSLANQFKIAIGSGEMAAFDFELDAFAEKNKWQTIQTYYALKRLEDEGYIQLNEAFFENSKLILQLKKEELYHFQVANGHFDSLLKALLRLYGGELFTQFVYITENQIARTIFQPENTVKEMLLELHKANILTYHPRNEKPQLLFLKERLAAHKILPDTKKMLERKALMQEKANAVIHYLEHPIRCRTQLICTYFDEINDKTCGICDNCLKNKKIEKRPEDWNEYLVQLLKVKPMTLQELELNIKTSEKEAFIQELRTLIDSGKLSFENGFFNLK
jgi:ATP-dependent DNA helicase RecQ